MKHITATVLFWVSIEFTEFPHSRGGGGRDQKLPGSFCSCSSHFSAKAAPHIYRKPERCISHAVWHILHQLPFTIFLFLCCHCHCLSTAASQPRFSVFSGPFNVICHHYSAHFSVSSGLNHEEEGWGCIFKRLRGLEEYYSINGKDWYDLSPELLLEKTTECISFHWVHQNLSIYTVVQYLSTAPLFVCSNGEKKKIWQYVSSLEIKTECPIYLPCIT